MKNIKFGIQTIVLLLWIFVVGLLFTLIHEKRIAGVIAGIGFIFIPTLFIFSELKQIKKNYLHMSALCLFLIGSALPIFFLRVLNWDVAFSELSLLGASSEKLHNLSNVLYGFMLLSALAGYIKSKTFKAK